MENDEDDYEVLSENTPQSSYLQSLGYSSSDFISAPVRSDPSKSKFPELALKSKSFIVSVCKVCTDLYTILKEIIVPRTEYSGETELIKRCGLLFKENVVLVEEFSPPLSNRNKWNCFCLRLLLHSNFIFLPLAIVTLKGKKLASAPVVVFLSFTSVYSLAHLYKVYIQLNSRYRIKVFVSSLKQYNQKFLKALQFISENDKNMMTNYSRLAKIEISGYNSLKVVDPSWLHFKTLVVESTVSLLKDFHSLCRVLNELPVLKAYHNYLSVCSVDFCDLCISGVETDSSHEAYILFVNKLKLLLFLIESELLSFIAINLSKRHSNSSARIGYIFSAISNICKILVRSSNKIEHSFNRFYGSDGQELSLEKSKIADTIDPDILNVFLETRALAHSTLSAAVQVRNLEKFIESKIKTPQSVDKSEILTFADETLFNIEYELISSERKLKSLTRYLMLIRKPSSDRADVEGDDEAKSTLNQDLEDIVKTGIEVGQSDFNPTQPDEVFVGISAEDVEKANPGKDDHFSEEYFMAEVYNRSSKNLIKELKVKLKDKKSEMVEREKIALRRQNITDLEERDNLSFESSDEENCQEELEISDSPEANFNENVSFFGISHLRNEDCCTPTKLENLDSLEDDLIKNVSIFESLPLADGSSCSSEVPETPTKNSETAVSGRLLTSDSLIDSEERIYNPLAMSVANISRVWNQELSRTEECFGSDSECSSDCDN